MGRLTALAEDVPQDEVAGRGVHIRCGAVRPAGKAGVEAADKRSSAATAASRSAFGRGRGSAASTFRCSPSRSASASGRRSGTAAHPAGRV